MDIKDMFINKSPTMEMTGYEPITTFWRDFSVCDFFGDEEMLKKTYEIASNYAKSDYKKLTELVIVLNHKLWEHYYAKHDKIARIYDKWWKEMDSYACNHLKGEELSYFYKTTD